MPSPLRTLRPLLAAALASAALAVPAQDEPPELEPIPEPPTVPGRVHSGETLEPEVRITRRDGKRVTEYRLNGQLQAIKVEGEGFPAYYLVDQDGDGRLEHRVSDLDGAGLLVPHWVILSW